MIYNKITMIIITDLQCQFDCTNLSDIGIYRTFANKWIVDFHMTFGLMYVQ